MNNRIVKFREALKEKVLIESISINFDEALLEWRLYKLRRVYNKEHDCICKHKHIMNLCFIKNIYNKKVLLLGNDCIERFFIHIEVKFYFNGIKSLKKLSPPNEKFLEYCKSKFLINDYEYNFLSQRYGKKKYSTKQRIYLHSLCSKLFNKIINQRVDKQWEDKK